MGADSVVLGPPTSAQLFGTEGIVLDQANSALYVFGTSRTANLLRSALKVLGIQTALTAITTAQNLLTYPFGAGALNVVGRTFVVKGALIYSTTAANVATVTIALTLGGVTLCTITTAATNTTASTNLPIQFEFTCTVAATGTSGTFTSTGSVKADIGTAAASAIAEYLATNTAVSSSVNLLQAETLAVTLAASAAVPSATLLNATVELVA
jgi:hypothetical protein